MPSASFACVNQTESFNFFQSIICSLNLEIQSLQVEECNM